MVRWKIDVFVGDGALDVPHVGTWILYNVIWLRRNIVGLGLAPGNGTGILWGIYMVAESTTAHSRGCHRQVPTTVFTAL